MKRGRQNGFNPKVLIRLICKCMPVISAVPPGTLVKCWIRIRRLTEPSLCAHEDEIRVVEGILQTDFEFFLGGLRRQSDVCAHRAEVGYDSEDAFGLFGRSGVRLRRGWRSGLLPLQNRH